MYLTAFVSDQAEAVVALVVVALVLIAFAGPQRVRDCRGCGRPTSFGSRCEDCK